MDDDKLNAIKAPLAPWFPPWTLAILIVNGAIVVALLASVSWAARRGDIARVTLYRRLLLGAVTLTVGGHLLYLVSFVVPVSIVASKFGVVFTLASVVPLLVWVFPVVVLVDLLRRRSRQH